MSSGRLAGIVRRLLDSAEAIIVALGETADEVSKCGAVTGWLQLGYMKRRRSLVRDGRLGDGR